MNVYMLSFTSKTGLVTRTAIQNYLDTRPEALNWFGIMPNTILIVSRQNVEVITDLLTNRFGQNITFVIAKLNPSETNGFINKEVWDFINNPRSSGKWQ